MEFSKKDMVLLKGVAISFMLLLHLFCRKEINGLYETYPMIDGVPLVYYIGLFGDACVPIFLFASGYGLLLSFNNKQLSKKKSTINRIFKLLINYWIVLFMFISIGYFFGDNGDYPGSIKEFLLNFFVVSSSYNGAWWFVQTYLILVLIAPWLFRIVKRTNPIPLLFVSGMIYFLTYIQRIKQVVDFGDNSILLMIINSLVLVGTSQFSFIVGSVFADKRIYSKLFNKFHQIKLKNFYLTLGILLLVVIHSLYESMIIAPLTAFSFICFFSLMDKGNLFQKVLTFLGKHSTNIWLTHMFFYMTIFPELTFAPRFPMLIFIWLLILCCTSSYLINLIYKLTLHLFERSTSKIKFENNRQVKV
jgi:fucose 4-O-acetylase-like acetyltransferase